ARDVLPLHRPPRRLVHLVQPDQQQSDQDRDDRDRKPDFHQRKPALSDCARHETSLRRPALPAAYRPPPCSELIIATIGRNIATPMVPTMPPITITISGSSRLTSEAMATSTSSS